MQRVKGGGRYRQRAIAITYCQPSTASAARGFVPRMGMPSVLQRADSQFCRFRHELHCLTDPQIVHNLLRTAQHGRELLRRSEACHKGPHSSDGQRSPSKDLTRLAADEVGDPRALILQQGHGAGQIFALVVVAHVVHLVRYVLGPVLDGLQLRDHCAHFLPDGRLLDEPLPEYLALMRPFHALLNHAPHGAIDTADDRPALMVEVGHDDLEALILFAQEILHRHLHILKLDVGGPCSPRIRRLNLLRRHPRAALDQEHRNASHP
mmetsp:Transcript_60783/g.100426  ORF Transcript_60783/g.100426 Transcript_60783/m.100426 type:complete len:265 (-) Transcript_60783:932-1726(-)